MYQVKTLNKISSAGLNVLGEGYKVGDDIEAPDAILVRSASMHEMELPESVKAIARAGAGVNNIPVAQCTEKGVVVFNTPGANANAVKELVIAALLLSSRKIYDSMNWVQTLKGKGDQVAKLIEKGKSSFSGPEIGHKKLGVIGLGAIGRLVANAAIALGMEVYGYDPYITVDGAWDLSSKVTHAKSLSEIYTNCDYITIHVPLTPDTKAFINAESIASMKDHVRILNFARGDLVNESDILAALAEEKVAAYVTDFPTDAMIGTTGVLAIPHLGASTPESEENCAYMAAWEVKDFLENGNLKNSVNFPRVEMPRTSDVRICVIHRNLPNVLSRITEIVSKNGMNIENMHSKSKQEYAYTILDVSAMPSDAMLDTIRELDAVIRVWAL